MSPLCMTALWASRSGMEGVKRGTWVGSLFREIIWELKAKGEGHFIERYD